MDLNEAERHWIVAASLGAITVAHYTYPLFQ